MPDMHDGTIIAADTTIKGEMSVENRARILGRFEGTIRSKGQLEVADKGTCKAAVEANTTRLTPARRAPSSIDAVPPTLTCASKAGSWTEVLTSI